MYHIPFLITPALVCLFWIFVHGPLAARTLTFRLIIILFSFIVLAILGDVILAPLLGSDAIAHIVINFSIPCLIPLACLYLLYLYRPFVYRPRYLLWIIFPVVLTTATVILTVIMGLEDTNELLARIHSRSFRVNDPANSFLNQLYYYWAVLLLQLVMAAEMAFMVGFILVMSIKLHLRPGVFTNLLRGKRIRVLQAQIILTGSIFLIICLKLAMHAAPFHDDPVWALSFAGVHAILYFLFGFFALFSAKEYISWHDITTAFRFNYKPETQSGVAEEIITDMSGLLSASSFNSTFKRISGFTPKVWKARKDSIAGR